MLRRHVWLILFMTILGGAVGGGGWYLVRRYRPLYQAETVIKVLPPIQTDPMEIVATQVQQDIQYGHRVSLANLMKSQSNLQRFLQNDRIRATKWYRQMMQGRGGDGCRDAVPGQEPAGHPHREAEHIVISMRCGQPGEAALIANEMASLFVAGHGDTQREDVRLKLVELTAARPRWRTISAPGRPICRQSGSERGSPTLETPTAGRYFQNTITIRLNDLELQKNQLDLAVGQLKTDIENLSRLAQGPITEQIAYIVERDSVMLALARDLAVLEAQLSGRLAKFGEGHRTIRQIQEQIQELQTRGSNGAWRSPNRPVGPISAMPRTACACSTPGSSSWSACGKPRNSSKWPWMKPAPSTDDC
jgi:hypothetical protein